MSLAGFANPKGELQVVSYSMLLNTYVCALCKKEFLKETYPHHKPGDPAQENVEEETDDNPVCCYDLHTHKSHIYTYTYTSRLGRGGPSEQTSSSIRSVLDLTLYTMLPPPPIALIRKLAALSLTVCMCVCDSYMRVHMQPHAHNVGMYSKSKKYLQQGQSSYHE